jgi:PAS domain S-box-containing protein
VIEPSPTQLASFQLELAMALTESSELVALGRSVLMPLLRRLDCSAGVLLRVPPPPVALRLVCEVSLPRNHEPVSDTALLAMAAAVHGGTQRYAALADGDHVRHVFVLPGWGLLKLRRRPGVIADPLLRVMLAMSSRIAMVAQAATVRRALVDSDARQHAVLESALDGIVSIDANDRIVAFNASAEAIFGVRRGDAMGRPMREVLMPHRHRKAHAAGMDRYMRTGHGPVLNRRIEVEGLRADGEIFPMELAVIPVRTSEGEIFTATVRDISERQRAQRELRNSEARARAAFEQAAVGVLHQMPDRRIVRVNLTLCDMLGYTAEEVMALGAQGLIHPEDQAAGIEALRLLFAGQIEHVRQEKRCRCKDGTWRWVRVTLSPMRDDDGVILLAIAIVEDISERRRAEAEAAAAREREVSIASRIQTSLLVQPPPPFLPGLQMSIHSQASQQIDGDFVEVLNVGSGCVDIITGDVMGKGLAAAMIGAATKLQISRSIVELLLRQVAAGRDPPQPSAVVASLQKAMTPTLQALDAFVTLFYVRIDSVRNVLTWVGCGHEEGLLADAGGGIVRLSNQHPPVGVLPGEEYKQESRPFESGEWLMLCSDGVADAVDADGQRMGRAAIERSLIRRVRLHSSAGAVLHSVRNELMGEGVSANDDVTMVVLKRESDPIARIELPVSLGAIRALRGFAERELARTRLDDDASGLLQVAAVEAFTNIVRHGRDLPTGAPVEVIVRRGTDEVVVELVHLGADFQPPAAPAETDFGAFPEGGLGLTIMYSATNRLEYEHVAGVNRILLRKSYS